MNFQRSLAVLAISALSLISCGGGGGDNGGSNPPGSTAGEAQGVYAGTATLGTESADFEAIILPNDRIYAVYGVRSGGMLYVYGFEAGQGRSDHGNYTASILDYLYTGDKTSGNVSATYSGVSFRGQVAFPGTGTPALPFTATKESATTFNFDIPATLADATGTWQGYLLDGEYHTIAIGADGRFAGGWGGSPPVVPCTYEGSLTPSSSKNYFTVTMNMSGTSCPFGSVPGVAVVTRQGELKQLIIAVASPSFGTVFIGNQ